MLGVDASRHLISFFEPLLAELNVTCSRDLRKLRSNAPVTIAGVAYLAASGLSLGRLAGPPSGDEPSGSSLPS